MTYAQAGVDIDAGNALVDRIKPAQAHQSFRVMSGLGGFGAHTQGCGLQHPILVGATDGVGTKLRIAIDTGHVDTVGTIWLQCVNDLVCQASRYFSRLLCRAS